MGLGRGGGLLVLGVREGDEHGCMGGVFWSLFVIRVHGH